MEISTLLKGERIVWLSGTLDHPVSFPLIEAA
jgi:hypothetical protein